MSNISGIVGGVVALALVNRLLDRKDTTAPTTIKPLIPVTQPTPVTPTPLIKPVMPTQQEITRERFTAPSGTPEQAALLQQAYTQGRIKPFGTGVSLKDLFGRQR